MASSELQQVTERFRAKGKLLAERQNNPQDEGGVEEKKGLEFMAIRFNVIHRRRHLQVTKQISPTEYFLLEEIELATIGGQNHKSTMASEMDIDLKTLAYNVRVPINRLYATLKSLEQKFLIIRKPSRYRGMEIIGLNPQEFGPVLTDKVAEMEARRKIIKAVPQPAARVDKSEPRVDKVDPNVQSLSDRCTPVVDPMYESRTCGIQTQDTNDQNSREIIEENRPLEFFKSISRGFIEAGNRGELNSLSGEQKPKRTPEEHARLVQEQLAMVREGRI